MSRPRRSSCGGVAARKAARIRGVPGLSHSSESTGTCRVQDGRRRPASSASFSAIPASRASTISDPDFGGRRAIAVSTCSGWSMSWSMKARNLVQSGRSPVCVTFQASVRSASAGRCPLRACCGPAERTTYRAVDHTDDRCETRVDHPAGARYRYTVFRLTPSALATASTVCSFTACRR